MNRSRRQPFNKQFVPGGVYDPQQNFAQQRQQQPWQQQQPHQQQQQRQQQPQQQHPQQQPQQQQPHHQQPSQQGPQQTQTSKAPNAVQQQSQPQSSQPVQAATTVEQPAVNLPVEESLVDESGRPQFKKIFVTRKKPSVRAKEKKIRQNRQLRKAILPKNALMALNEVKGVTITDSNINNNADGSGGYTAVVTVNDKQYEGKGSSKITAKNCACEKALRDYVLEKMRQRPRIPKTSTSTSEAGEPMDESQISLDEGTSDGQKAGEELADDVPMINLASFAIYKLFSEWESEGFEVPELHPSASNGQSNGSENGDAVVTPRKSTIRTELPPNWEAMHPATLLCMMRPGLTYTDCGTLGEKPNVLQRASANVDGEEFFGTGRSKKAARRSVAVAACNKLFGTTFVNEEAMEV